jgi:uncharacterized protein
MPAAPDLQRLAVATPRVPLCCKGRLKRNVKELIEYMCRALVDEPDQVKITQVEGAQADIFELSVAPGDTGKIIGRQGRIINAMRTLVRVAAAKQGKHAVLEVV